jgi:maltose O-acetyltransferase
LTSRASVTGALVECNEGEIRVGHGVTIISTPEPVRLLTRPGAVLELGEGARIDAGTTIAAFGHVRVGAHARLGARCRVLDDQRAVGIVIGDGAQIDDDVTILAGATIAPWTRVARGAVVSATSFGAPELGGDDEVVGALRATVARVLPGAATVPADADLVATAAWTSLTEVQLIVALEERFGIVIDDGALRDRRTLSALATLVSAPEAQPRPPASTPPVAPAPLAGSPAAAPAAASRIGSELRALRTALGLSALCVSLANLLPAWSLRHLRVRLLRAAGCHIAPRASFFGAVALVGPAGAASRLQVGEGCIIGPGVTFGLDAPIVLGRNVSISPGATLYTGTHHVGRSRSRMDPRVVAHPVVIEDGAWIGMQALVLPGVRVGAGAIVSAGAVVTSDVPPNTLVAGNPAVAVRELPG